MFFPRSSRIALLLLRLAMGWLMLYAGLTKIFDPAWSAAGYLEGAKTFTVFFQSLTDPSILPLINLLNEWGLTLLGLSLIIGLWVRWSSILGAILMMLYYFPILDFPYPNPHSFIIDEHLIYALVLLFFAAMGAGRFWGLDGRKNKPVAV